MSSWVFERGFKGPRSLGHSKRRKGNSSILLSSLGIQQYNLVQKEVFCKSAIKKRWMFGKKVFQRIISQRSLQGNRGNEGFDPVVHSLCQRVTMFPPVSFQILEIVLLEVYSDTTYLSVLSL